MSKPSAESERPIDRALSLVAEGDALGALRYAVPVLEQDRGSPLASFVVGHALAALERSELSVRALETAARAAVDGGNLPLAVACGVELRRIGSDPSRVFTEVAEAFGHGSPRLRERRAAPPELPGAEPDFEPLVDALELHAIVERATAAIEAAKEQIDERHPAASKTPVAPQALFSALGPESLRELVSIFEVQVLASGAVLVEEGSVGDEAFIVARGEVDVEKRPARKTGARVKLARLGAGALVGEMALLSRAPRVATVITVRPSIVLVGHKHALDEIAERAPAVGEQFVEHCKRRMLDNLVRTSPLFRQASPAERPSLVERFALRTFEPGSTLTLQGQPSEGLHLIASGLVSILHRDTPGDPTLVATLGPGDVVGEVALILRRPAIADAVVQHPTVTLFLPRERILELVRAHPQVFADLYELAVHRDVETASMAEEEATAGDDYVFV